MQLMLPLAYCSDIDAAIKAEPLFNQTFFQMVDVTNLSTLDSFLQDPPDRIVHWIEIRTVHWLLQWADEVRCPTVSLLESEESPRREICSLPDEFSTIQQDSPSAHHASETVPQLSETVPFR